MNLKPFYWECVEMCLCLLVIKCSVWYKREHEIVSFDLVHSLYYIYIIQEKGRAAYIHVCIYIYDTLPYYVIITWENAIERIGTDKEPTKAASDKKNGARISSHDSYQYMVDFKIVLSPYY